MSAKSRRAKRLLTGRGVAREDSDDELGTEELAWEWIRSDTGPGIVGARFGDFACQLGDCVLLKAEVAREAWVGLICAFETKEEGEKCANFMWFSTDKEIRNKAKKRHDALENELYITASFDWNPLTTINGSARVLSLKSFLKEFPSGHIPSKSSQRGKVFVCRRGCNTRTATYTPDFTWEDVYQGAQDIHALIKQIKAQTKATRSRSHGPSSHDDNAPDPVHAKKRRRLCHDLGLDAEEGRRSGESRINLKRSLEFKPLGERIQGQSEASETPYQAVRNRLHVSCVPPSLPCRETAFDLVFSHLEAAIVAGTGSCIYISGTPGTGKTATVREVTAQMHAAVEADELDDFIFVEINGMKITDPHQSYALLWEAIQGTRVSPSHALSLLNAEFSNPSPRRVPCVVLMDELDQLATKNQSVMYNFFNWPTLSHSRLIVLAVANTMDLPERTLSNKISSRLGLIRITFAGYTYDQLMKIIQSRLDGVAGNVFDPDAVQFASRKVAAVSGDARRALEICRRAVEIAEGWFSRLAKVNGTDLSAAQRSHGDGHAELPRVTINTIKEAIKEATSSPFQQLVKNLPWTARLLLAAFVHRMIRNGIAESNLAEVVAEAKRQIQSSASARLESSRPLKWSSRDRVVDRHDGTDLPSAGAFQSAFATLIETGVVEVESRRRDRTSRIRLAVRVDDVSLALKNDSELRSCGIAV